MIPDNARYVSLSIALGGEKQEVDFKFNSDKELIGHLLKYAEEPILKTMCTEMYDQILFEEGAVLWHCTQGKDRAGCASAMLLAALDKVDARYGSFRNYLTHCIGVTPEMMNTLRERYLG